MEFLQAVVLGLTQGISEFLPISSDGHLILVPAALGWERFGLGFDVMLHLGTLLATVAYFRRDLGRMTLALFSRSPKMAEDRRLALLVIYATVPSVIIALALEGLVDQVETLTMTTQVGIAAGFLILTSGLLAGAEFAARRWPGRDEHVPLWKGLLIGVAQGFAVAPGLSRSGTTIATAIGLGIDRETSARFSFLLSVPIVAAATAKKLLLDVVLEGGTLPPLPVSLIALAVTTAVGYAAISFLLPYVKRHSLFVFAAYTALVGVGITVLLRLGVLAF